MVLYLFIGELSFEVHKEPAVTEEVVGSVGSLYESMQVWIDKLHKLIQGCQLQVHAGGVVAEVGPHFLHQVHETPECQLFVLHDVEYWRGEVRHSLLRHKFQGLDKRACLI